MKPYWVEADRAVKDHTRVIGYSVWKSTEASGRYGEKVRKFAISRTRSTHVALHLANTLRDDLNAGIA